MIFRAMRSSREILSFLALSSVLCALMAGCGTGRKLSRVQKSGMSASIQLPESAGYHTPPDTARSYPRRDTLKVTGLDGREVLIMRAVLDEESGEMVATDVLDAAFVTARFRNVAERHGKVELEFQVIVPSEMQDSRWQLRLHPDMYVLGDSVRLDDIVVTGADYRRAQLKGYQHYNRFLSKIIPDSDTLRFIDVRNLEIWLQRNIPRLYAFKNDSTEMSDSLFESCYGVDERQAVEHYTIGTLVRRNRRLKARQEEMYRRYVKVPIVSDGIRLDTVIRGSEGMLIYNYVQTINTRPKLRKVDIVLAGEIFEQDRRLYSVPSSDPLTFYISSVSSFADLNDRYLTKIISRNVEANATCHISFQAGKSDLDENLQDNGMEMGRIKANLRELLTNEAFVMDSIVVTSSASPEGNEHQNNLLSFRRAKATTDYFIRYIGQVKDSLKAERGYFIEVDEEGNEGGMRTSDMTYGKIDFMSRSGGENWLLLDDLIRHDTLLTDNDRRMYSALREAERDNDRREAAMSRHPYYGYVRNALYPKLRTVSFDFHLHRKGMLKDTVHTTVLDSIYMKGVQAISDRDYELAIEYLAGYADYNTAVAYVALDRNMSALSILEAEPRTAPVNYMLALVYSRLGDDRNAVECYLHACEQDGSYVHRGNLDPEISSIIRRYGLDSVQEPDE